MFVSNKKRSIFHFRTALMSKISPVPLFAIMANHVLEGFFCSAFLLNWFCQIFFRFGSHIFIRLIITNLQEICKF